MIQIDKILLLIIDLGWIFLFNPVYISKADDIDGIDELIDKSISNIIDSENQILEIQLSSLIDVFWHSYIHSFSIDEGKSAEKFLIRGLEFINNANLSANHPYYILFESMRLSFGNNSDDNVVHMMDVFENFQALNLNMTKDNLGDRILRHNPFDTFQRLPLRISYKFMEENNLYLATKYLDEAGKIYKNGHYYEAESSLCVVKKDAQCEIDSLLNVIEYNLMKMEEVDDTDLLSKSNRFIFRQNLFNYYSDLSFVYSRKIKDFNAEYKYLDLAYSHLIEMISNQDESLFDPNSDYLENFFKNPNNVSSLLSYLFIIYTKQKPSIDEYELEIEYLYFKEHDNYFKITPYWDISKPVAKIKKVKESSFLYKKGLRKNDYILNVNGWDVNNVKINDVDFHMEGRVFEMLLDKGENSILKIREEALYDAKKVAGSNFYEINPQLIEFSFYDNKKFSKLFETTLDYNTYNNAFKVTQLLINSKANKSLNKLYERIDQNIDPYLIKLKQDLSSKVSKIKNEILNDAWGQDKDREDRLYSDYKELKNKLLEVEKKIGQNDNLKFHQKIYELDEVVKFLDDDEALIMNFEIDKSFYQWIILNNGNIRLNKIFPSKSRNITGHSSQNITFVEGSIKKIRDEIKNKIISNVDNLEEIEGAAQVLHNMLIGTDIEFLGQRNKKIFLSYGDFAKVPPSILVVPLGTYYNEQQIIGEDPNCDKILCAPIKSDNTISNIIGLISLEMRSEKKSKKIDEMKYLGIGNPKFQENSILGSLVQNSNLIDLAQTIFRDSLIADRDIIKSHLALPETENEIKTIASNFKKSNTKILLRHEASETNLKSMDLSQYDVISFATHSIPSYGDNEPGLVLSLPKESSLNDDGVLTPGEIVNLDLNAKLVILSACNTANGKDNDSEILSGLAQAFLYAGAESIIVTHWPVETNSTVLLMTSFFDYWLKEKMDPAEALKHAKIDLRNIPEYNHPIYWAGFSYYGL